MAVTLREVAARAGVSPITVSRALNNTGYVSHEARARVFQAAAELNYVPNAVRQQKIDAALKWLHDNGRNEKGLYGGRFDLSPSPYNKRFELIDQASAARAFLVARP